MKHESRAGRRAVHVTGAPVAGPAPGAAISGARSRPFVSEPLRRIVPAFAVAGMVITACLGGCSGGTMSFEAPVRTVSVEDFVAQRPSGRMGAERNTTGETTERPAPSIGEIVRLEEDVTASETMDSNGVAEPGEGGVELARQGEVAAPGGAPSSSAGAAAGSGPGSGGRSGASGGSRATPAAGGESRVPREWIVESLVGQVNGRPIFADEFFEPIEDRIRQMVEAAPRPDSRDGIVLLVSQRFDEWVNNELIISEAESQLTPEQQQGLLAWLREAQEGEIAARGGTRTTAEEDLQESLGMSIEEYMAQRRNFALTANLLRTRISPRVIVAWRDIEREYFHRVEELGTGAIIDIGRIVIPKSDELRIQEVRDAFASGKDFATVARELQLPEDGRWVSYTLGEDGIDGTDLSDALKDRLRPLAPGEAAPPFEQGTRMVWVGVLSIIEPNIPSIYDRDVQLGIRNELMGRREEQERVRYLSSLRERWVQDNIEDMRIRLIEIALRRYWR